MNWIRLIHRRFANSPAVVDGQQIFEVGNTDCFINLQSVPENSLILDVDALNEADEHIRRSIRREQHCDYVATGCVCAKPFLMLIEAKSDARPRARRIRYAARQTQNSETIAIEMMQQCNDIPSQLDVYHVVVTRRISASTMTRWHKQTGGENIFRNITLVFSGDDIWQAIQGET